MDRNVSCVVRLVLSLECSGRFYSREACERPYSSTLEVLVVPAALFFVLLRLLFLLKGTNNGGLLHTSVQVNEASSIPTGTPVCWCVYWYVFARLSAFAQGQGSC